MTARPAVAAVGFDFDGVILESAELKARAFYELYEVDHGPAVARRALAHHLSNLGIPRFRKMAWIAEHVVGKPLTEPAVRALGERFGALVEERVLAAPLVPGVEEALRALAERGVLRFVASGTPEDELVRIIRRRGLERWLPQAYGAPREKREVLRAVLAAHAIAPERAVFIGDGMSDYEAARAASVPFVARDTPALHDAWVALGVARVSDLSELPALLAI